MSMHPGKWRVRKVGNWWRVYAPWHTFISAGYPKTTHADALAEMARLRTLS